MSGVALTRWAGSGPPTDRELGGLLEAEGLTPRWWSNGPGDRYGAHSHPYHKVLYCARGAIRFESDGGAYDLQPGDRLDIPPGTSHSAVVGPHGCSCVEASGPR